MSYFNEIYNDPELNARAKQVLVYLHDRANKDGESWYAIGTMAKRSEPLPFDHKTGPDGANPPGPGGETGKISGERGDYLELLPSKGRTS